MGLLRLIKSVFTSRDRLQQRPEARAALLGLLLPQVPVSVLLEMMRGGTPLTPHLGALKDRVWSRQLLSALADPRVDELVEAWHAQGGYEEEAWRLMEGLSDAAMWREELINDLLKSAWVSASLKAYEPSGAPLELLQAPLLYMPSYLELAQARASLERDASALDKSPSALRIQALDHYLSHEREAFAESASRLARYAPITGGLFEAVAAWSSLTGEEGEALREATLRSSMMTLRRVNTLAPFNLFVRQLTLTLETSASLKGSPKLRPVDSSRGVWERVSPFNLITQDALSQLAELPSLEPQASPQETPQEIHSPPHDKLTTGAIITAMDELSEAHAEHTSSPELPPLPYQSSETSAPPFEAVQTLLPTELIDEPELEPELEPEPEPELEIESEPQAPPFDPTAALTWAPPPATFERTLGYEAPQAAPQRHLKALVNLTYGERAQCVCLNTVTYINSSPSYPLPEAHINLAQLNSWLTQYGAPLKRHALVRLLSLAGLRLPDEWEVRALSAGLNARQLYGAWTRSHGVLVWSFERNAWAPPRKRLRVVGCALDTAEVTNRDEVEVIDGDEAMASSASELLTRLLTPITDHEVGEVPSEADQALHVPQEPPFEPREALVWVDPATSDAPTEETPDVLSQCQHTPPPPSAFPAPTLLLTQGALVSVFDGCAVSARRAATEPYSLPEHDIKAPQTLITWVRSHGVPQQRSSASALLLRAGQRLPELWEVKALVNAGEIKPDTLVWTRDERALPYDVGLEEWSSSRASGARYTLVGLPIAQTLSEEEQQQLPRASAEPESELFVEPEPEPEVIIAPEPEPEPEPEVIIAPETNAEPNTGDFDALFNEALQESDEALFLNDEPTPVDELIVKATQEPEPEMIITPEPEPEPEPKPEVFTPPPPPPSLTPSLTPWPSPLSAQSPLRQPESVEQPEPIEQPKPIEQPEPVHTQAWAPLPVEPPQTLMGMSVPQELYDLEETEASEQAPTRAPSTSTPPSSAQEESPFAQVMSYEALNEVMSALPSDEARAFLELLFDGRPRHVSELIERVGGTSLGVSLMRNKINATLSALEAPLTVHSEFKPQVGERPHGIYYSLQRAAR